MSKEKTEEQLGKWITSLSKEQLRMALMDCISELELSEMINYFIDDEGEFRAPYWTPTGETIVD